MAAAELRSTEETGALRWGLGAGRGDSGARPGEFREEEVSAPPLLLGSQLPAASARFLPLGGQGLGAQRIPVQAAGQEGSLPLPLRAPDDLGFLDGTRAVLKTSGSAFAGEHVDTCPATGKPFGWGMSVLQIRPVWSSAEPCDQRGTVTHRPTVSTGDSWSHT